MLIFSRVKPLDVAVGSGREHGRGDGRRNVPALLCRCELSAQTASEAQGGSVGQGSREQSSPRKHGAYDCVHGHGVAYRMCLVMLWYPLSTVVYGA